MNVLENMCSNEIKSAQATFVSLCILSALFCGCGDYVADSLEVKAVKDKVTSIRVEADAGSAVFGSRKEIAEIEKLIMSVSDLNRRRGLVEDYAQMLVSVEIAHPPYQRWENVALGYFAHLDILVQMMEPCGCSSRRLLDAYFKGLLKFKDACFSVPNGPKRKEESLQEFAWRRDCARKLKEEYVQRMSEIRRFWMPHLKERLPAEFHDEFRERIIPFLQIAN